MDREMRDAPPLDEILLGIWRHRLKALVCLGAALGLGMLYVIAKPKVYTAQSAVRMEAQVLPEPYLSPTVSETVVARLAAVRHELMSERVLTRLIEEENLLPGVREKAGMVAAIEALRGRIEVRVEGENVFLVSYRADSAEEAAKVANRLPEIYAEIAHEERAEAAERAAAIFRNELERIRPQVEALEGRLVVFKKENATSLPETLEANLRQIDRLNGLTEATLMSLADAQRRRTALARYGAESNVEVARLASLMNEARRELAAARSIYTEEHPQVATAQRAYDTARARFESASSAIAHGDSEQARVDGEIQWLQQLALGYQQRSEEFSKRVEATPGVGEELNAILRDYDGVREKYRTLLSRKVEAEIAQDLERRQKGSLFRVVEPALPPSAPSEPNPMQAMGMSLLLGLGLGLAVASYSASRDTSIRSVAEAKKRLGLTVLATVPSLERKRRAGPSGD